LQLTNLLIKKPLYSLPDLTQELFEYKKTYIHFVPLYFYAEYLIFKV